MKDIFVTKYGVSYPLTGAVAGVWESNGLNAGTLAIFNQDGSVISDSVNVENVDSDTITGKMINLVMMTSDITQKVSVSIPRKGFKYSKLVYTAPVKAIKVLGGEKTGAASTYNLNLPASISAGDLVGVNIIDLTKPFENTQRVKEYSFIATSSDVLTGTGASNVLTKLAALINADSKSVVVATVNDDSTNNTGLVLTAKIAGNDFAISKIDGVLKDADVVEYKIVNKVYTPSSTVGVVANDIGHGTAAQVAKQEVDLATRDGKHVGKVLENELWSAAKETDPNKTYLSYVLIFTEPRDGLLSLDGNVEQLINIYVPVETDTVGSVITSGTLMVGAVYKINTFAAGDDFSNVGGTNETGNIFVATGTTPTTWTNSSSLIKLRSTSTQYALDKILPLIAG